jgi:hypothetical protein
MKNIILVALIAFSAIINTNGQSKAIVMNGSHTTHDTVTNAGTTYLTSPSLAAYESGKFAITLYTTNISGTSTYKAIVQGSNNGGTSWEDVFQVAGTDGINCDTLQVTSAAPAVHSWNLQPMAVRSVSSSTFLYTGCTRFLQLRVACVGTGTQSTRVSALVLPIK